MSDDTTLPERIRKVTIHAAAEGLAAIDRLNKSALGDGADDENRAEARRRIRRISGRLADLLSDVAKLGLDQIDGLLKLHGRYADDYAEFVQQVFQPAPRRSKPEPKLLPIQGRPGELATVDFLICNDTGRPNDVSFTKSPLFRDRSADHGFKHPVDFNPAQIRVDPDAHEVVTVSVKLNDTRFQPGKRYVADIDVRFGDRVAYVLVLNLHVLAPNEPASAGQA